jgi:hypothetical protein
LLGPREMGERRANVQLKRVFVKNRGMVKWLKQRFD